MYAVMPDVLGLDPAEAEPILEASGLQVVRKQFTRPPRGTVPKGDCRVVRQRLVGDDQVELVLTYQSYVKEVGKWRTE